MPIEQISNRPRSQWEGGAVPVPNMVFDILMPTLRDTELRVLLVVIRQTLGWQEQTVRTMGYRGGNQRKGRDYISHSQLCRRTGRASAAVSSAVDSLIRRGLIVVEDIAGKVLATPDERRRYLGKQFFRPIGSTLGITLQISGKLLGNAVWEKRKQQKTTITKKDTTL